jgi:hypothetical protein
LTSFFILFFFFLFFFCRSHSSACEGVWKEGRDRGKEGTEKEREERKRKGGVNVPPGVASHPM